MERQKRNLLVVLIAVVIAAAMISSFGLGLFAPDTAKIVLPTPAASGQAGPDPGGTESGVVLVDVTPETVQSVIATLSRPESYYREVTVEDFWGEDGQGVTTAQVWVDGGWTMAVATLPGGAVRTSIVGDGQLWLWYGDGEVFTAPADESSADLEGQRIPTYEDVLDLDQADIAVTDYREQGGLSCIYVETAESRLGYVERYWVAVDTGLLVCAETVREDRVVYRMSAYAVERPVPADAAFALPDGTELHTPGE